VLLVSRWCCPPEWGLKFKEHFHSFSEYVNFGLFSLFIDFLGFYVYEHCVVHDAVCACGHFPPPYVLTTFFPVLPFSRIFRKLVAGSGTVFQNQDDDSRSCNKMKKIRILEELVVSERWGGKHTHDDPINI
jgi:hypothetical protein